MKEIPPSFLERMQQLLREEYDAFLASYDKSATVGLRVNTLKTTVEAFGALASTSGLCADGEEALTPIPWCPAGFSLPSSPSLEESGEEGRAGKHPYHAAGLYYLQEPSAMVVAELLDPQPGERVLDLSAAPGGKATHLAALMQNRGLLIANEIHPKRAWILAENLERWGARNAAITNETPERLAEHFGAFFDSVLVDAPCSGEGMFRKSEAARSEWSPQLVTGCALRQSAILESAARLVRPGGRLGYATCTFAAEENEGALSRFLANHPEFDLLELPHRAGFAPGRPEWISDETPQSLQRAIRLWPHRSVGEGHFVAILRRNNTPAGHTVRPRLSGRIPESILQPYRDFCQHMMTSPSDETRLALVGSYGYHLPAELPDLSGLRVIHPGWWLGVFKKRRFEPAHALAMGMRIEEAKRVLNLQSEGEEVQKYLRGEILSNPGEDGWVLITVDGFPLGWGKRVQGVVKNYYPRGLRW